MNTNDKLEITGQLLTARCLLEMLQEKYPIIDLSVLISAIQSKSYNISSPIPEHTPEPAPEPAPEPTPQPPKADNFTLGTAAPVPQSMDEPECEACQ